MMNNSRHRRTQRSLAAVVIPMTISLALAACSSGKEPANKVLEFQTQQLTQLRVELAKDTTALKEAREEEGRFRRLFWDSEKVDALQRQVHDLKAQIQVVESDIGNLSRPSGHSFIYYLAIGLFALLAIALVAVAAYGSMAIIGLVGLIAGIAALGMLISWLL